MKSTLISILYFLFYGSLSMWLPFFNLYLKEDGFSGTQVGIIAGVYQVMLFFVVPVWGMLSDRYGIRRVLQFSLLLSILLLYGLQFIDVFVLILLYMLLLAFFHHPLGTLFDSLALQHIQDKPHLSYGALRVWGSLGWAVGTIVMGRYLLTQQLDHIFTIATLFYSIPLLLTLFLRKPAHISESHNDYSLSAVMHVFSERKIVLFLLLLVLYGVGASPLYLFINLYYHDIGASNQIVGLAFAVQALSELPFFFLGRRLVRLLGSPMLLLSVLLVAILRLFLYSLISNPLIAVGFGILQGITLSLFWVSVTDFLHRLVPPMWRSTGQSLIWAFHLGAGVTLGNMIIGRLSDFYSMQHVMLLAALYTTMILVATTLYFIKFRHEVSGLEGIRSVWNDMRSRHALIKPTRLGKD